MSGCCDEPKVTWTVRGFEGEKAKIRKEAYTDALFYLMDITEKSFAGIDLSRVNRSDVVGSLKCEERIERWLQTMLETGRNVREARAVLAKKKKRKK